MSSRHNFWVEKVVVFQLLNSNGSTFFKIFTCLHLGILEKTAVFQAAIKMDPIHQSLKLSFKYWHPKSRILAGSKGPSGTIPANILCLASFTLPNFCDWLFLEIALKTYVCTTYLDVDK